MDKTLKGSLEGVLPMTGLLILAAILATQSLPVSEALASVLDESSQEISAISENNANTDHITEAYIPDSMKYSVNNAAYELDNGGINWESEASSASDPSWILGSVVSAWREEASNNFNDRMDEVSCSIDEDLNYRIYPQASNPGFDFYSSSFENVTVLSEDSTGLTVSCNSVSDQRTGTYTEIVSTPNRYIELAKASSTFFYRVEEENIEEDVKDEYVGSETECGSYDDSGAKSEATSSYYSDTYSVSNIENDISTPTGISIDSSQNDEFTGSFDRSTGSQCNEYCDGSWVTVPAPPGGGGDSYEYCDGSIITEYSKTSKYTLTPSYSSIDFEASDDSRDIITEEGYSNLEIDINDFRVDY